MKRLILEEPWYTYQKKVKALFERDPAIHVGEIVEPEDGSSDYLFDIEVRDHEKFLAMDRVFPKCVQFGNVILAINLYGGSSGALISMGALEQGLTESELPDIIESWRSANPKIVQFWWDVEKAAIDIVKDHQERTVRNVGFQFSTNTLWIVLPSGRRLAYIKPRLQPNRFGRMAITYEGLNAANKWSRGETYSGKIVENITQSTARDLLAEAMWRMEQKGLDIVAHINDEVVLEVPKDSVTVEDVTRIMNENPSWAEGLPLSSAGYFGPDFYFED